MNLFRMVTNTPYCYNLEDLKQAVKAIEYPQSERV